MKKSIPLLFLLLSISFTAFSQRTDRVTLPGSSIEIYSGSFYSPDEKPALDSAFTSRTFLALYPDGNTYRITPVRPVVRAYEHMGEFTEINGEQMHTEAFSLYVDWDSLRTNPVPSSIFSNYAKPEFLITGLTQYNANPIPEQEMYYINLTPANRWSYEVNGRQYEIRAEADRFDAGAWGDLQVDHYTLYLRKNETEQPILAFDHREDTVPQFLFIGDIDGDGAADLIIDDADTFEEDKIVLYLSTAARPGELVGVAAFEGRFRGTMR